VKDSVKLVDKTRLLDETLMLGQVKR